ALNFPEDVDETVRKIESEREEQEISRRRQEAQLAASTPIPTELHKPILRAFLGGDNLWHIRKNFKIHPAAPLEHLLNQLVTAHFASINIAIEHPRIPNFSKKRSA